MKTTKKTVKRPNSKLTETQVLTIRKRLKRGTTTQAALAKKYGVSTTTISNIANERIWIYT